MRPGRARGRVVSRSESPSEFPAKYLAIRRFSRGLGRWRKAADNRADEKGDACANQEIPREGDARKPPYEQNYRESREHAGERATRIGGAIRRAQKKQAQQATER